MLTRDWENISLSIRCSHRLEQSLWRDLTVSCAIRWWLWWVRWQKPQKFQHSANVFPGRTLAPKFSWAGPEQPVLARCTTFTCYGRSLCHISPAMDGVHPSFRPWYFWMWATMQQPRAPSCDGDREAAAAKAVELGHCRGRCGVHNARLQCILYSIMMTFS